MSDGDGAMYRLVGRGSCRTDRSSAPARGLDVGVVLTRLGCLNESTNRIGSCVALLLESWPVTRCS